MATKPKILTFVSYYLPGYKAGGPLRTIANMVEYLGDDFEFWIVTRDRDLGDDGSYTNVVINEWNDLGNAKVFYLSSEHQTFNEMIKIINDTPHDVIYLNSFFDPIFTLKPLLARRFGRVKDTPAVLAPRGEFSISALRLKSLKKKVYIRTVKLLGLYDGIYWHASSKHEAEDIQKEFVVKDKKIIVALDLPTKIVQDHFIDNQLSAESDVLRVVFLSRISPMKNLDYALRVLKSVTAQVKFDIYGPIEDKTYWELCEELIRLLPTNIDVSYCNSVQPDDVAKIFAQYDLFLFPTRGENYGHVIAESLSVGTPVLISDQTPWRNLATDGLGWDISLDDVNGFKTVIETISMRTLDEKYKERQFIRQKVLERLTSPQLLETNRQVFNKPLKK